MRALGAELRPLDFGMVYLPVVMALADGAALRQKELAEEAPPSGVVLHGASHER